MRQVTCRTFGCENSSIGLVVPDDGSAVICGPCGNPITEEVSLD